MTRFLVLVGAALATASLSAAVPALGQSIHIDDQVDYVVPKGSPVQFQAMSQPNVASFRGQFSLSGTYFYGYLTLDPRKDAHYDELDLYFVPERKSLQLLPYWRQQGNVSEIHFSNPDRFVALAIPAETIRSLKKKKIVSASGRATIVVDTFQSTIECDNATYSVNFISVQGQPVSQVAMVPVQYHGC